jgi:hypothetical protein
MWPTSTNGAKLARSPCARAAAWMVWRAKVPIRRGHRVGRKDAQLELPRPDLGAELVDRNPVHLEAAQQLRGELIDRQSPSRAVRRPARGDRTHHGPVLAGPDDVVRLKQRSAQCQPLDALRPGASASALVPDISQFGPQSGHTCGREHPRPEHHPGQGPITGWT